MLEKKKREINRVHQFHHYIPHFEMLDVGLVFLTGGMLIIAVGTLLPLPSTLLRQWLNLCGLVLIYIAAAIFTGLVKARVDDYTGKGDSLF